MSLCAVSSCLNSFLSCWQGVNTDGVSAGPGGETAVLMVKLSASPRILEI